MDNKKPQVFIASSVEGLRVADAVNLNLDESRICHPNLWRTGTFELGSSALDSLVNKSSTVDFAVFIFTPDDLSIIREKATATVRDNVVFELGLFIGALGKERCYIVRPRDIELHLPSDLLGINDAQYASDRPSSETSSALNAACTLIKDQIEKHGVLNKSPITAVQANEAPTHVPNPMTLSLTPTDIEVLAECSGTAVEYPGGMNFEQINRRVHVPDTLVRMSIIKLTRMGYLDQWVEEGEYGGLYAYRITESGIDILIDKMPPF